MINNATCPEVSLGVRGNQSVKFVLFSWCVEGHGLHAHGVAVGPGIRLLELRTTKLPCHNIPASYIITWVGPEVVWCVGRAKGSAACDSLRLRLLSHWL